MTDKTDLCSLRKPLLVVIPPEGVRIYCQIHGQHFIPGKSYPTLSTVRAS